MLRAMKRNNVFSWIAGSWLVALLASSCCILPIVAAFLGVTGVGVASFIEPYRPYLLIASIILLSVAWWSLWKKIQREQQCQCETTSHKKQIVLLTLATIFVLATATFPEMFAKLYAAYNTPVTMEVKMPLYQCSIKGMSCTGCEVNIKKALEDFPGVHVKKVSYKEGKAIVQIDPKKTPIEKVMETINSLGYKAKECTPVKG